MTDETIDQAPEQSISDKIAAKFGFPGNAQEQQAQSTEPNAEPEDAFAEIEWDDGEKFRVPMKLKDGFMKNKDYTQKTQELADVRRTLDQAREIAQTKSLEGNFAESIAQERQEISVIDAYLQQVSKMDWTQMSDSQLLRHRVELDNIKERKQELQSAIAEKKAAFDNDIKARINELRAKSKELVSKKIPDFNEATEKSVRAFAQAEGLSEFEVDNVLLDPRSFGIVWKAMQFEKVSSGIKPAKEQAERILKPGGAGNQMPKSTAEKLNFNKAMKGARTSGEKANVIEQRLAGVFDRR